MFSCWLLVPLARAGHRPDIEMFRKAIADDRLRRLANLRRARFGYGRDSTYKFFDTLLCACELSVAGLRQDGNFRAILEEFSGQKWRCSSRLWAHDVELLFLLIRAYCLLCLIDGKTATVADFLGEPTKTETTDDSERRRADELNTTASVLIGFFSVRAKLLLAEDGSGNAVKELREAARSVHAQDYRIPHPGRYRVYELLMESIVDFAGFVDAEPARLVRLVLSVKGEQVSDTGHEFLVGLQRASENIATHSEILMWASSRGQSIGALRCTASEKIQAYLALARLTYPISSHESEVFFRFAHEATEELDIDSRHQLRAVGSLLGAANLQLDADQKRKLACDLGTLTSDAALSIGEEEGFPWRETTAVLAKVDPSVALAAVSRWEDEGLAPRSTTLEAALHEIRFEGIGRGHAAVALNALLESESLSESAFKWVCDDHNLSNAVLDDLCIDVLIFEFAEGGRKIVAGLQGKESPTTWLKTLRSTVAFSLELERASASIKDTQDGNEPNSLRLSAGSYTSVAEVSEAVRSGRTGDRWIRVDDILAAIRQSITPANRVTHLEAMMSVPASDVSADELVTYFGAPG
jgi:hypothetical protein